MEIVVIADEDESIYSRFKRVLIEQYGSAEAAWRYIESSLPESMNESEIFCILKDMNVKCTAREIEKLIDNYGSTDNLKADALREILFTPDNDLTTVSYREFLRKREEKHHLFSSLSRVLHDEYIFIDNLLEELFGVSNSVPCEAFVKSITKIGLALTEKEREIISQYKKLSKKTLKLIWKTQNTAFCYSLLSSLKKCFDYWINAFYWIANKRKTISFFDLKQACSSLELSLQEGTILLFLSKFQGSLDMHLFKCLWHNRKNLCSEEFCDRKNVYSSALCLSHSKSLEYKGKSLLTELINSLDIRYHKNFNILLNYMKTNLDIATPIEKLDRLFSTYLPKSLAFGDYKAIFYYIKMYKPKKRKMVRCKVTASMVNLHNPNVGGFKSRTAAATMKSLPSIKS